VQLTLIGKPGCHLCDDARTVVTDVMGTLAAEPAAPALAFDERSILDDPALFEKYVEDIPVLLIDGKVHTYWRVDPVRLKTALLDEK
jgi:hypothetical protein